MQCVEIVFVMKRTLLCTCAQTAKYIFATDVQMAIRVVQSAPDFQIKREKSRPDALFCFR